MCVTANPLPLIVALPPPDAGNPGGGLTPATVI